LAVVRSTTSWNEQIEQLTFSLGDLPMKFVCLGYHDEAKWQAIPDADRSALMDDTFAYGRLLVDRGHVIDDRALQGAANAATVRFDKGKASVTDGPFAETKEQLGGLMVIEASDLNEAIQLMSKMPCMRMGGAIEIRPVNEEIKFVPETSATAASAS
jgi:hypothetical protein